LGIPTLLEHKRGDKICDGLNQKLGDADEKHVKRKDGDAKKKLCDFGETLYKLAFRAKPIISSDEYSVVYTPLVIAQQHFDPAQVCEIGT